MLEDPKVETPPDNGTLYALANEAMEREIFDYLAFAKETGGLHAVEAHHLGTERRRRVILSGIGSALDPDTTSGQEVADEWARFRAIPFDVERALTPGVYLELRALVNTLVTELDAQTAGFKSFTPAYIQANPRMLPILMRLANVSSKAELKRIVGSISDNRISRPAAEKLVTRLAAQAGTVPSRAQLLQSVEPTLEGIVRDLVGRVLLESVVANALDSIGVPYLRESDYDALVGVVYDFRADFVVPTAESPLAFIEVRKSSSRHASLYAKDKMFSAINWKGRHPRLIAVLVAEGPWTGETLRVLARVYDYVVPLNHINDVVESLAAYLGGDSSKLRWLIEFAIRPASEAKP